MRRDISDPHTKYTLRHKQVDPHTAYSLRREPFGGKTPFPPERGSRQSHETRKKHTLAKFVTVGAAMLGGYALYQMYPEMMRYLHRKSL